MEEISPVKVELKPANQYLYGVIYQKAEGKFEHQVKKPKDPGYGEHPPLIDTTLPEEDRAEVENVKTRTVLPETNSIEDVQVLMAFEVHPDEQGVIKATKKVLEQENFPRTELDHPHPLAAVTGTRGAHRPATNEEIKTWPEIDPNKKDIMLNMKVVPSDPKQEFKVDPETGALDPEIEGSLGIYVDLNRSFEQPDNPIPWPSTTSNKTEAVSRLEQTYKYLGSKEAVLLAEALRLHPNAQVLVTWHEDYDRGGEDKGGKVPGKRTDKDGIYIYRCVADAKNDPRKVAYDRHHAECMDELKKAGFDVYEGPDDPEDPELGLYAHNGLIYQSFKKENGDWVKSRTFEGFAVRAGGEGVTKMKEVLAIETPMLISQERKDQLAQILMEKLVKPHLHDYGVPHTETEETQSQ